MKQVKDYNELNKIAIEKGDFNAILKINSRYINQVANQYAGRDNFLFQEYQQLISISLYKAFKTYLSTENSTFIKYAQIIILNDLRQYYSKNHLLRMSVIDKKNKEKQTVVDIHQEVDDNLLLIDTIVIPDESQVDITSVMIAINNLKPKYAEVLLLKHGLKPGKHPMTFQEMEAELNTSRQALWQQYKKAIEKLKLNDKLKERFKLDNETI